MINHQVVKKLAVMLKTLLSFLTTATILAEVNGHDDLLKASREQNSHVPMIEERTSLISRTPFSGLGTGMWSVH